VTTTIDSEERARPDEPAHPPPSVERERLRPLTLAAVASLSAGAVHAATIGAHADHPQAAKMFAVVALVQLLWGGVALIRRSRSVALVGCVLNGALFGGWVLAKRTGISLIDGLDYAEPVQFADGLCAALALFSAVAAAVVFLQWRVKRGQPVIATAAVVVVALLALPGMVEAGRHRHELTVVKVATKFVKATALVPRYDPRQPIDLGGVKGVTAAEQVLAEGLVADTLIRLPKWANESKAKAGGYTSLTEQAAGFERVVNWPAMNDKATLDPDHPEGLIYKVQNRKRTLVAAIFMLPPGSNVKQLPDVGGPLAPWDTHDNLCAITGGATPHVAGFADAKGICPRGQVKLKPVPTTHVWIVAHPCGPFALNTEGAGKVGPVKRLVCPLGHPGGGAGTDL
jgi:hypothetical protein